MGRDIHLYVEYKKDDCWYSITDGKFSLPRINGVFATLAGARFCSGFEPVALPKGFPADCSYYVFEGYSLQIVDDPSIGLRRCSMEDAQRWIASGQSVFLKEGVISDPDWHTPSWLTVEEFREAVTRAFCIDGQWRWQNLEYRAVLALMEAIDGVSCEVRAVFWFDN